MSALYVRDLVRGWADAEPRIKFYDSVNRLIKPTDDFWWTMEFFATNTNLQTFCAPGGYWEEGNIDLLFCARPGAGDSGLLTILEPVVADFLANLDPQAKFSFQGYEPVTEASGGDSDAWYRLVVGTRYAYNA